jgi:DNA-binding HxlR family transcriptional regulator
VGFNDVRRAVGLHQEIVSRILRRLVNHGAVRKEGGRYVCNGGQ